MAFRNLKTPPEIKIHNLGAIATAIRNLNFEKDRIASNICDELHAFNAPSECGELAFKNFDSEWEEKEQAIFAKFGIAEKDYAQEIRLRCSSKFAYTNQL